MSSSLRVLLLAAALAVVAIAIVVVSLQRDDDPQLAADTPLSTFTPVTGSGDDEDALAFVGIVDWVNSEPLQLSELRGKVVVLDFWTYTCVNCLRTLPFLSAWYERYQDDGLEIIGVHAPEFEFEKVLSNVAGASEDLGVTWPVALDSDRGTWRAFGVRAWPTKIILGRDGTIRHQNSGEGAYGDTEELIRDLLSEGGHELAREFAITPEEPNFNDYRGITRETYGGYLWAAYAFPPYIGNGKGHSVEPFEYFDSGDREDGSFYLQGLWRSEEENVVHVRNSPDFSDYIVNEYTGGEVNAVVRNVGTESFLVKVTLDGEPVPESHRGPDVYWDEETQATYYEVTVDRMYRVIKSAEKETHDLIMAPESDQFALHAYTFGP